MAENTEAPRPQSLPWLLLSGILGLFAVGTQVPGVVSKDAPKAAAKPEPAAEGHHRAPDTNPLLKPIEEFYSTHDGRWGPEDLGHEVHGYQVEFLIATVPDPIDSPFGYAFDQVVDAIQRGVQQKDGYLLDRAWLPWEIDRKAKPGAPALRETNPGVLLFRHGKDASKKVTKPGLCVVLLVGETPLGGIQKKAFWKALTLIANSTHPPNEPVRVVAPYFTGSQTSLQFLLKDWHQAAAADAAFESWLLPPRPTRFRIVMGNASAVRAREFFRSEWGPEKLEIGATVVPARVQMNAVLHFLTHRDGARAADAVGGKTGQELPGRVAILAESNTGFGKQFAAYGENDNAVVLRFPLHVSRLKTEYAQAFRKRDEQAGLKPDATVSPVGFEEAGADVEGVPAQGGAATAAANNAVLANILATVSRERYRYVGVMATDTRDKLFLIRLIRENCPDVHIFVTDGDVLLTHPDYRYHMKGVIVGSTYPLFPPNQQWVTPNAPERLLLSSSAAQGYYNATLAVLGQHDQMLEYGPPAFAAGEGVPSDRPPVWVSMVAPNGAIVPLQVFTGYEDAHGYVWLKPGGAPPPPPTGLRYPASLYLMGIGLAAFWAFLLVKCWRGRGVWGVGAAGGPPTAVGLYRTVLLGAQFVFAVAAAAVVAARAEHYGYGGAEDIFLMASVSLAGVAFLVVASGGLSFRYRADGPGSRAWRWTALNLLVLAGLVAFTAAFLGRFWATADRAHRALFFVRAVDLATGLSPLVPLFLMCMAVTVGAYFQLERHELARRCRVPSPFPSDSEYLDPAGGPRQDRVFDPLTDLDRRLKVEMTPGRFWRRHRLAVTGVLTVLCVGGSMVWRQALPTVEGGVWDAVFAVGFWCIYAFAAFTVLQVLVLWRQTKQLLAALAHMPLMRVFARLPLKVSAGVAKHLYSRGTQPLLLQMSVHQLRRLADAAKGDEGAPPALRGLESAAADAEARLRQYVNPERGKAGDPAEEAALREVLSNATAKSLAALSPRWKALPTEETFGGPPGHPTGAEPPWVARAEELAATHTVNYLSQFMIQLRSLMLAALVCSSLLLMAATCYPFHPERLMLVFLLGLVGAAVATVVYVFADMSWDETLSRVSRSSGRLSLDGSFVGPFVSYVVPTLGLLAVQLSGTFRWALEPILRVMK